MNRMMRNKLDYSTIMTSTMALLLGLALALPVTAHEDVPDDGTLEAGATLRYRDNGDGTITDRNTILVWEKKSDDGDLLHDVDNFYTWSGGGETIWDWLEDINTENGVGFAGHNDWRIPNVRKLQSIVDYERFSPSVAPVFNTNCTSNTVLTGSCTFIFGYWSSSSRASNPSEV
jgi:uncharacterized protein DUF1566